MGMLMSLTAFWCDLSAIPSSFLSFALIINQCWYYIGHIRRRKNKENRIRRSTEPRNDQEEHLSVLYRSTSASTQQFHHGQRKGIKD